MLQKRNITTGFSCCFERQGKARQGSTATATRFVEFQNLQQNLEMSSSIGFLTEEQWRLMRSASYGQDSMPEESSKLM